MIQIATTLKKQILTFLFVLSFAFANATGEPSTWFNIFVPPNNDAVHRDVCLVITAIQDSTHFSIIDDGADGDTDDTKTGVLMAGQSYILYIKDNGINDDAKYASGGTLKQDGDYFMVTSDKLIYASQSTNSDWQHDWVPSTTKSGLGQKFIVYAPQITSSKRDLNTFAYFDSTVITIRKISFAPTLITGYTNISTASSTVVVQKMLMVGQDIIYYSGEGRDLMSSGDTYVIEASKPITLQYGALYGNERDGGGYVPSANGSSAGELFYFGVPFQSGTKGEQEIRIASWDNSNSIILERYYAGSWVSMKTWTVNSGAAVDWVGKNNGSVNYSTSFRVRCSAGKKVSVFEANWLETGSPGTADIGTMASSDLGTSSGNNFLIYMAPPGHEENVRDPFTNALFGQMVTHAYLFSFNDTCIVSVKDAYSNGIDINRTYTVLPGRYVDCFLTLSEWQSIYNGTGNNSGPERPYLKITSNKPISVMNTNFNDNWMMYFGSSLEQSYKQISSSTADHAAPGDTVMVSSQIVFSSPLSIDSAYVSVIVGSGAKVISSVLKDQTTNTSVNGTITEQTSQTLVNFAVQDSLLATHSYVVQTQVIAQVMYNNGSLLPNNTVVSAETNISGKINGTLQQSSSVEGIQIISANTSNLMFSIANFGADLTDSWTANIVDVDNDGLEDIYLTVKNATVANIYYRNTGNNTFIKSTIAKLTSDAAASICSSWADYDNDGDKDVLVVNNTKKPNSLYRNNGNGSFTNLSNSPVADHVAYFHSGSFADYDNDGFLDIFLSNYMPTKFNELYHNNGNGTFSLVTNNPMSTESYMSLGSSWADYDNDGDQDLFVPNGEGVNNSLFLNNGNGTFTRQSNLIVCNDGGNSVGSCWGDINNDGWLDLFVSNASNENDFLYLNNKSGGFTKITGDPVVNSGGHSHGCSFADLDNDMDLDLYVTNDKGVKFLYLNDGAGNFTKKQDEIIAANFGNSMGNYFFDADKDGDLDLFVPTHSGQINYYFTNNGNANNWTSIRLAGSLSNKDAIGARVQIKAGGVWQSREVNSQSGLGGQSSIRCHFGLGINTVMDSIVVLWPSGQKQYLTQVTANTYNTITEPSGGVITGVTFYDSNNNCVKDGNENTIAGLRVDLGNNFHTISNAKGEFRASLPVGVYSLALQPQGVWQAGCPVAQVSVQSVNSSYSVALPLTSAVSGVDLKVDLATTAMRRGFKNSVYLQVQNNGSSEAYNVPLNLSFGGYMTVKSSQPSYTTFNNGIYTWLVDTLKPGQVKTFSLMDSVYLSRAIGSSLNFTATATYSNDLAPLDNSRTYSAEVVGAIDPNDLVVSPRGEADQGFVKKGTTLFYKVRFQNVGNYMASNISISDRLPEGLSFSSIAFVSSSHPCEFNYSENGEVNVRFENINLEDSSSNFNGSQGYLIFSVTVKEDVEEGAFIPNSAAIFFDYEDALSTNAVLNTVTYEYTSEALLVFPNPGNSDVTLQLLSDKEQYQSGSIIEKAEVFDLNGQLIKRLNVNRTSKITFQAQTVSSGVYQLRVQDGNGQYHFKKLVIVR
ncbi:hypothetical protein CNR22_22935 [Sphingobacteriaceae bacterium]|nr:hypothetical protein CNR22_22935 [Sphingobacteriaceae bacterium]